MKVYELMTALSEMDAGAEVVLNSVVTLEEVANSGYADIDGDKQYFEVNRKLKEVGQEAANVFLYSEVGL